MSRRAARLRCRFGAHRWSSLWWASEYRYDHPEFQMPWLACAHCDRLAR